MLEYSYTPAAPSVQPVSLPSVSLLTSALALAGSGIPVFPCRADKAPACAGGFKSASTDPAVVRELFSTGGDLIGVPTGAVSGFDVVDVDPRNGGEVWWTANERHIPPTLIHETRSGGKHVFLRHQAGVGCSAGRIAPGVDVRGDKGYVIHWPSAGCPIWLDWEIEPWPASLLEGLTKRPTQPAAPVDTARLDPPSAAAVVDLLDRLPNPLELGWDDYARVNLAAAWCANATGDDDGAIRAAANAWSYRWEGGSQHDEEAKWDSDWSRRTAPLAGWQTLQQVAKRLIPEYGAELAAAEFNALPALSGPSLPVAARRRIIAPGQCEGATARPYRVKGLLADRDVGCLFGPPGAGKSLLAPLLAYKLAQGEPFFGLKTRQGSTLYVAAEDESGMERRVNASVGWFGEQQPIPDTDATFDSVPLQVKHVGAITEYSRGMLLNSTADVDALLRTDLMRALAVEIDRAALIGTGDGIQPRGIRNTAGVAQVSFGNSLSWPSVLALPAALDNANVPMGAPGFVGNGLIRSKAMGTLTVPGTASPFIMTSPDSLAGYRYAATNIVPVNPATTGAGAHPALSTLIFGSWENLLVGVWDALDLTSNPYSDTAYRKGSVQVRIIADVDVAVRHGEAFAYASDVGA